MAAPSPSLSKYSHSKSSDTFFYDTFTQNTPGLIYQGGTHVLQGSTFLRLTQTDSSGLAIPKSVGRVLYSQPIKFWESSLAMDKIQVSFEATITFKVTPFNDGAAHGLAFFIAPVNTTIPSGATGGIPTSSLFAVEFENSSYRVIGIDIGSTKPDITTNFDSGTGELVTAQINYNSKTSTISVVATSGQRTASLTYAFDLSTILPQQVQVGISSAAGETETGLGVYDVFSWYFHSYESPNAYND